MIAYHFPPVGGLGAPGSQRILKFSQCLPEYGWKPAVLTVRESSYESYLTIDHTLLTPNSNDVAVIRTRVYRGLRILLEQKRSVELTLKRWMRIDVKTEGGGAGRSRSRPPADRNGHRHAQSQGLPLCSSAVLRRDRYSRSGDDLWHVRQRRGNVCFGPVDRGVLEFGGAFSDA